MRRTTLLFLPLGALFMLACVTVSGTAVPTSAPETSTELAVIIPHPNLTARPLPSRTPTPTRAIFTPIVFPPWVADFSEPVIKFVENQHPIFSDEFPPVCIADEPAKPNQKIRTCSTPEQRENPQDPLWVIVSRTPQPPTARPTLDLQPDLQNGYAYLNSGWYFDVPGSPKNPYLAHIDSGALILKLPEGKENKDLRIYNTHLLAKNFLLQFDLEFEDTQPQDTFRFEFKQGETDRFALDVVKEAAWTFYWGTGSREQSRSGSYQYFSIPAVRVLIIARGAACAVYLNDAPVGYFEDCRTDPNQKVLPKSAAFHIISDPLYSSVMRVDNVTMWDLDQDRPR